MTVDQILRFAVLYADGRAVTNLDERPGLRPGVQRTTMSPSGGRSTGSSGMVYYVQPLPPPGRLTFICEWPALGIAETRAEIDAQQILDASARAVRPWPDQDDEGAFTSLRIGYSDEEPDQTSAT